MNFKWSPVLWNGGVVYIDAATSVSRIRLSGFDHYWRHRDTIGVFNSTDQYPEGSRAAVAYRVTGDGWWDDIGDVLPPPEAEILDGIMLPDDLAREYGIL